MKSREELVRELVSRVGGGEIELSEEMVKAILNGEPLCDCGKPGCKCEDKPRSEHEPSRD